MLPLLPGVLLILPYLSHAKKEEEEEEHFVFLLARITHTHTHTHTRETPHRQDVSEQLARNSFNIELEPDLDVRMYMGGGGHRLLLSPQ